MFGWMYQERFILQIVHIQTQIVEFRRHKETGDDFEKVVHFYIVGKILEKISFIFGWKKFESF